jgi:hypothetical protein
VSHSRECSSYRIECRGRLGSSLQLESFSVFFRVVLGMGRRLVATTVRNMGHACPRKALRRAFLPWPFYPGARGTARACE